MAVNLMDIARQALRGVAKGTPTKDAAEIVRRAISAKSSARWFVTERADKPGAFWISVVNGGNGDRFEISKSSFERNGLYVSLYQSH